MPVCNMYERNSWDEGLVRSLSQSPMNSVTGPFECGGLLMEASIQVPIYQHDCCLSKNAHTLEMISISALDDLRIKYIG